MRLSISPIAQRYRSSLVKCVLFVRQDGFTTAWYIAEKEMALELKTICEKCGRTLIASGVAYICSYECTYCASCAAQVHLRSLGKRSSFAQTAKVNLCGDRVAKSRL